MATDPGDNQPDDVQALKDDELRQYLNQSDPLVLIIRGHLALDAALAEGIIRTLPVPHRKLVRRLGFPFKVDLCIGLGISRPESREMLLAVHTLRNRFAHTLTTSFVESDAAWLKSRFDSGSAAVLDSYLAQATNPPESPVQELQLLLKTIYVLQRQSYYAHHYMAIYKQVSSDLLAEAVDDLDKEDPAQTAVAPPVSASYHMKHRARFERKCRELGIPIPPFG